MNTIVYGDTGSGKTYNYFTGKINEFDGQVIAISPFEGDIKFRNSKSNGEFKKYRLDDPIGLNVEEVFSNKKIFLEIPTEGDSYWSNMNIVKIIEYLYKNGLKEKLLIDINDINYLDLSNKIKIGDKEVSLIMALIGIARDPRVEMVMILQGLSVLKKQYPNDYEEIVNKSNIICTKELEKYSGEYKLRMPRSLHKRLMEEAAIEGISFNQYLVYKLMGGTNDMEKIFKNVISEYLDGKE
ncbi:TPA: toxin-antitoxin system HicB family antitoxin [Clostridium perfringens]